MAARLMFCRNFSDQPEWILFIKDFSVVGGFLLLVAYGAGALGLDGSLSKDDQRTVPVRCQAAGKRA